MYALPQLKQLEQLTTTLIGLPKYLDSGRKEDRQFAQQLLRTTTQKIGQIENDDEWLERVCPYLSHLEKQQYQQATELASDWLKQIRKDIKLEEASQLWF